MVPLGEEILDFPLLIIRKHASRFFRMVVTMRQEYKDLKVSSERLNQQAAS
jgi:hypothetical protein